MIDITGLVKANSAAPAPASKPEIKNKDTRKVWDMTLEEIGYYLSLCDSNEKAMRFMSLLSPEQIKMITEEGEKASAELVAENEKIEPDDEALFDSADDEDSEEAEYESDDADFFNSDDDEDPEEEEYEASEDESTEDEEEPTEAPDADEALFEDSDEDEEEPVESSDADETFFEDSDEDEEPDEDVSAPSAEVMQSSEPSNPQEIRAGTATQATEPSVAEGDEMFFDNSDEDEIFSDDSDDDTDEFEDDSDDTEEYLDNSEEDSDDEDIFADDSDEDSDEDALFADNSDEDAGDEDIFSDNAEDDSGEEEVFNAVQPSVAPQPIRPQPVVIPKQKQETGTVPRNIPVKTSQIPADKTENPVRNPVGTSTRGYDVSNKKNLCGEKYQDGWSLIKYLQANRGNKKACSKEVVLHYYSLEAIERGEDMGKFVISKGILRF